MTFSPECSVKLIQLAVNYKVNRNVIRAFAIIRGNDYLPVASLSRDIQLNCAPHLTFRRQIANERRSIFHAPCAASLAPSRDYARSEIIPSSFPRGKRAVTARSGANIRARSTSSTKVYTYIYICIYMYVCVYTQSRIFHCGRSSFRGKDGNVKSVRRRAIRRARKVPLLR